MIFSLFFNVLIYPNIDINTKIKFYSSLLFHVSKKKPYLKKINFNDFSTIATILSSIISVILNIKDIISNSLEIIDFFRGINIIIFKNS